MSEQVLKPPQERGKQNYSERGLGQAAPTQLFLVFFFFRHEWLPHRVHGPRPPAQLPTLAPLQEGAARGLYDHSAKRMRD